MNMDLVIGMLVSAAVAVLLALPLGKALRAHPGPFYLAAAAVVGPYTWAYLAGVNLSPVRPLALAVQKGYLSVMLLLVVMFTGVLPEGGTSRKRLQPVRGELSILSFIFVLGHLATYLASYFPRLGKLFSNSAWMAASLTVAFVLTAVFLLLSATSLRKVRTSMDARRWKALQRLSYLMMVLLALHIGLVLGRSAFSGGFKLATVGFFAYLALLAVYAVLRVRKALADSRERGGADGRAVAVGGASGTARA